VSSRDNPSRGEYLAAVGDFRSARRHAMLEKIASRLSGKSADLLSYEEVRDKLRITGRKAQELREIPLKAIVGSVGRYADFTRSFLPEHTVDEKRWAGIMVATTSLEGLPPIEVYQIGEVFFVLDGNHRVSVARQLGVTHIEAYVTKFQTKVPLSPDDQPDDLILKAEHTGFLERTHLDRIRPQTDFAVTVPGRYRTLEEQIEVHRYFMGLDLKRDISYEEAVASWHDTVYLPVIQVIREEGILRNFPDRTEADLYLWASKHRAELVEELGWEIDPAVAATDLAREARPRLYRVVTRIGEKIRDVVTPDELEAGPAPGEWGREQLAVGRSEHLFGEILVPITGEETGWHALAQAFEFARREGAHVRGLNVLSSQAEAGSKAAQAVQSEFNRRCQIAGIPGDLAFSVGEVPDEICARSRFADLLALYLRYPPPPKPLSKLGSGIHTIIRRCVSPVLAVPGQASSINHILLAYDGSPKAKEALYVATYLAGAWQIPLTVITVVHDDVTTEDLEHAGIYLASRGVQATAIREDGPVAPTILVVAEECQADLILMGGYGRNPLAEAILGSVVDEVLRSSRRPVMICG
jgi:nucleotide-binding universal stress UspA family protein